jgi:hypothetical protein
MFENAYGSGALLDGLVISVHTYGLPAGQLSSGWRVLGYRPMRLLCLLMRLEAPPHPLRGEHAVATREDLLEALAWQRDEPGAQVQERAKQGLGIADRVGLLVLVRELFGEEYLPTSLSNLHVLRKGFHPVDADQLEGATRQTVEERQGHAIILAGASWHVKPGGGSN